MRIALIILASLLPVSAFAETLVAVRTIRAKETIGPADVIVSSVVTAGSLSHAQDAIGLEARTTIYQGRPLRAADLGPPAIVERNQIVWIEYDHAGLQIRAEGRALDRAAIGERVRVMNLSSRITVAGTVSSSGKVSVP